MINTAAIMLTARKMSEMSRAMVVVAARERWDHGSNQPCRTKKDDECCCSPALQRRQRRRQRGYTFRVLVDTKG